MDIAALKDWFQEERRVFPWRNAPSPYEVWISEVMLQQTQAVIVIPYFQRWMALFPTVESLAEAHLDVVLKAWEGLGYYSRARNLHEGAKAIVARYSGKIPAEREKLQSIKGLGPYTIGAILSFAFHQKAAAVDGNVLRVLTRYFMIKDNIAKPSTVKRLQLMVESLLPDEEPWVIAEALIELGATICQRKAHCGRCPLKPSCLSYRHGVVDKLPNKTKPPKTEKLYRAVAVISHGEHYLVKRGEPGKIMSDLYEFPFFEVSEEGLAPAQLQKKLKEHFGISVSIQKEFAEVSHSFTRYHVRLNPVLFACEIASEIEGYEWKSLSILKTLAFSSGHRRLFQALAGG